MTGQKIVDFGIISIFKISEVFVTIVIAILGAGLTASGGLMLGMKSVLKSLFMLNCIYLQQTLVDNKIVEILGFFYLVHVRHLATLGKE